LDFITGRPGVPSSGQAKPSLGIGHLLAAEKAGDTPADSASYKVFVLSDAIQGDGSHL